MIGRYRRELSVGRRVRLSCCSCWRWRPRGSSARTSFVRSWSATPPVLVAAVGMTLVILCRQIDISIGSIFSICGVVAGLLAQAGPADRAGRPRDARGRRAAWGRSTARSSRGWACRRSW